MITLADLQVGTLGPARHPSPLRGFLAGRKTNEHYVDEQDRVLLDDTLALLTARAMPPDRLPTLEPGGPRQHLFFSPGVTTVGIVTCGGLCPGLNDVIRGLVMELTSHYDVGRVLGFRYGYAGLVPGSPPPVELTRQRVEKINEQGGTILGTSRGAQDSALMAAGLVRLGVDILFVIGGDGSMRGATALAATLREQGRPIAVIGIPKTIDNDIPLIGQSFGFTTAYTAAARTIRAAQVEAQSAIGGIGLVRVMGRHSGFIACYAALANHDADVVLVPEVPFGLAGESGLLATLVARVKENGSAVVVVAEGAGQELLAGSGRTDASGNQALADIGTFLRAEIAEGFARAGVPSTLKYFDPGYEIRSVPAQPHDAVYCLRLAQAAAHAGMAGRTDMVVGRRHNRFVHVPIAVAVSYRNEVAADGDLWLSVLESTGQPRRMGGA